MVGPLSAAPTLHLHSSALQLGHLASSLTTSGLGEGALTIRPVASS